MIFYSLKMAKKEGQVREGIPYIPQSNELDVSYACYRLQLPLMLRGTTGIGKTTLVSHLANELGVPLVSEPCNEDTVAADLIGRNLPSGWVDGSATRSLRHEDGAIYYLDELGEAREDAIVVMHSLTDDRRELDVSAHDETLRANDKWMLVASYNPFYRIQGKIKPSTAQRFITLDIGYPNEDVEASIVNAHLGNAGDFSRGTSRIEYKPNEKVPIKELVHLANDYRRVAESGDSLTLREGPGTRLVARTARLIQYGLPEMLAIEAGMINPLTYDPEQKQAMKDIAEKLF